MPESELTRTNATFSLLWFCSVISTCHHMLPSTKEVVFAFCYLLCSILIHILDGCFRRRKSSSPSASFSAASRLIFFIDASSSAIVTLIDVHHRIEPALKLNPASLICHHFFSLMDNVVTFLLACFLLDSLMSEAVWHIMVTIWLIIGDLFVQHMVAICHGLCFVDCLSMLVARIS